MGHLALDGCFHGGLIQHPSSMEIPEQQLPNKPNFLLIVIIFSVAIIVILVLAYLFLRGEGTHMLRHADPHHAGLCVPVRGIVLPANTASHTA